MGHHRTGIHENPSPGRIPLTAGRAALPGERFLNVVGNRLEAPGGGRRTDHEEIKAEGEFPEIQDNDLLRPGVPGRRGRGERGLSRGPAYDGLRIR